MLDLTQISALFGFDFYHLNLRSLEKVEDVLEFLSLLVNADF